MRRDPNGKPIRTKPRMTTAKGRTERLSANQLEIPHGWRPRPWGGGAKLTRADATRGMGSGIRNDK